MIAPVWVILPKEINVKLRPIVDVPNAVASILLRDTSFVPLLDKLIAPVNRFEPVNVIACAPAVKLEVPGTVAKLDSVIAPPAVTLKFPPLINVNAVGNAIAALLKFNVRLRNFVSEVRLVGNAAPALVFSTPIS